MNTFISGLASHIQRHLELKHAIGLTYDSSQRHLVAFDQMCARDFASETTLTKQMAMAWVVKHPAEHVNGQLTRISSIRQLAKHMASQGIEAYVLPPGIAGRRMHYHPHIFSHRQLRSLFDAADKVKVLKVAGQRHLIIPVIFRMIYCLGLRPGEARRLHRNDVDLVRGTVFIRESKSHRDRMVFMSPDLHEYCRHYDAEISSFHPDRVPFFPNRQANFYSSGTVTQWFHQLLSAAGPMIAATPSSPPRPYDLRHAHVIEVINRAVHAGQSPEALVAYLSLHLGHSNTEDTWYYFHLTADFHPELRVLANASIEHLLPEAHHAIR